VPHLAHPRCLLVEDHADQALILRQLLHNGGFDVAVVDRLDLARQAVRDFKPQILLLDLNLPDGNGQSLIEELQSLAQPVPVIVLSGVKHPTSLVRALEEGADDYVMKPFHAQELLARLHAVLRRSRQRALLASPSTPAAQTPADSAVFRFGPYALNLRLRELSEQSESGPISLTLSSTAFALLRLFVSHPYQPLSRQRISSSCLGRNHQPGDRTVDVQMGQLRKLLEADPQAPVYLRTVWGEGYVFTPDGAPTLPPPAQQFPLPGL
jgi:two-component system, OmpR family, phosphate regulon response regulator OmpR